MNSIPGLNNLLFLNAKHVLHVAHIGIVYQGSLGKISLALGRLFGQNVTFKGVLSFHFTGTCEAESLLGTRYCFHFGHGLFCLCVLPVYFFFGLIIMIIRFPSSFGSCSTAPSSASSFANLSSSNSPRSLKTMVRPLKNTKAFTL